MTLLYRFLVIILFAGIGAGSGFGLSYLQTEKWEVSAQFEQPTIPDLGNYYNLYSTYNFLNTNNQDNQAAQKQVVEQAYDEFKRHLTSADLLQDYLMQTESVKLKAQVEKKTAVQVAAEIVEQFELQKKSATSADSVSLISDTPEDAKKLLSDFILLANSKAREKLNGDLIAQWKVLFGHIKTASELNLNGKENNQVWAAKLQMMRSVQPLDNNLNAYRLVKSPSVSLKPISPDRLFWLMIGALSGLVVGFMLSFTVKSKKTQAVIQEPTVQ